MNDEELFLSLRARTVGILNLLDSFGLVPVVSIDRLIRFIVGRQDWWIFDANLIAMLAMQFASAMDWQESPNRSTGTTTKQLIDILQKSYAEKQSDIETSTKI